MSPIGLCFLGDLNTLFSKSIPWSLDLDEGGTVEGPDLSTPEVPPRHIPIADTNDEQTTPCLVAQSNLTL